MFENLFEDSGEKIKSTARILFILECISFLIVGFAVMGDRNPWYYCFIFWIFGPLVSYYSSLLLYGFGELISNSTFIRYNASIATKKTSEQRETTNYEKKVPSEKTGFTYTATKVENNPVHRQELQPKKTTIKSADTPPRKGLGEHLNYALQFSTDDGMKRYLNSALDKLSVDEKQVLNSILAVPQAKLRTAINDYLNSKKEI